MVAVKPEKGENIERAIKRFLKKCKKLRIVEDYCDRQEYKKPSVVRREAKRRRKKTLDKLRKEYEASNQ
jgi:small subunit ribosomal protein S21